MAEQTPAASSIGRVLREPTFHFVLLAAALFAISAVIGSRNRNVIEIDRAQIVTRIAEIEALGGAPLSAEERQQVEEAYIDEQVLVREAQALGLEDDARIYDVLVQKMLHVLSADVIQPTDAELEAYYDANRMRYAPEPSVTVDEIVVATTDPLPVALRDQLRDGIAPEQLVSDLPISHNVLPQVTLFTLTRIFGETTADLVFGAQPGEWVGPHQTVRGQHWLRLTERIESVPPPLDVVREQVRLEWIGEQEAARLAQRVTELRGRYSIVFTGEGATP
ncbi:MAG: peptidyl-prolyl cis-trans isomerase [Gemmatimonadetes bacterium]|nr:peptidyl-prolyl cis-trans isomerase [Gemmatimonadota bacterium]